MVSIRNGEIEHWQLGFTKKAILMVRNRTGMSDSECADALINAVFKRQRDREDVWRKKYEEERRLRLSRTVYVVIKNFAHYEQQNWLVTADFAQAWAAAQELLAGGGRVLISAWENGCCVRSVSSKPRSTNEWYWNL